MRKEEFFICSCGTPEHMMIVRCDRRYNTSDKEFVIYVHLNHYLGFFKRFIVGLKYIFGLKNDRSSFDTIIMPYEDVVRLSKVCDEYTK